MGWKGISVFLLYTLLSLNQIIYNEHVLFVLVGKKKYTDCKNSSWGRQQIKTRSLFLFGKIATVRSSQCKSMQKFRQPCSCSSGSKWPFPGEVRWRVPVSPHPDASAELLGTLDSGGQLGTYGRVVGRLR